MPQDIPSPTEPTGPNAAVVTHETVAGVEYRVYTFPGRKPWRTLVTPRETIPREDLAALVAAQPVLTPDEDAELARMAAAAEADRIGKLGF